jgi:ornithine carbamoyltransferase
VSGPSIRHFLDLTDIPPRELRGMIETSRAMKKRGRGARAGKALAGRMLAMIFDKPSTRTRVSFDVAMRQLGGDAILLTGQEMQLGRGETIADTAKVLSRYVDAIMIRTLDHRTLTELARHASVPVINGLTHRSHPCQVMADVLTFEEHRGPIKGKTVAWTGDANNVLTSWMHAAQRFDFALRVATPPELAPKKWLLDWVRSSAADIQLGRDLDGRQGGHASPQPAQALPGQRAPDGESAARRAVHALPARPPRRGGHRRGDRRAAVRGVRRGGKPFARAKRHSRLVLPRRRLVTI